MLSYLALPWFRFVTVLSLGTVALSLLVFARRGWAAYEATLIAPGVAVTSGCEEESMHFVWRAAHGQTVYFDPHKQPYSGAYFNWLFYSIHARPAAILAEKFGPGTVVLSGRLVTALCALIGLGGLFWSLYRVVPGHAAIAAGLATFVFTGPIVGWWAFSIRPDVGALSLEALALSVLLLGRHRPALSVAAALALFYGAWSFKQTYLFGLAGAVLFMILRRSWRAAIALSTGTIVLWGLTFLTLGVDYRNVQLETASNNMFYLSNGVSNFRAMLERTAPVWLAAVPALFLQRHERATQLVLAADARLLGATGLLMSLPLAFAASCKIGAAANYFFSVPLFLALVAAGGFAANPSPRIFTASFLAAFSMQLLVAFEFAGRLSLADQSRNLGSIWAAWKVEPQPRFSAINNLNLPWLNRGQPAFVLAYNYDSDRRAGRIFEHGGVGGLISAGYFASLLLPKSTTNSYDGASLAGYVRGPATGDHVIFRRRTPIPP